MTAPPVDHGRPRRNPPRPDVVLVMAVGMAVVAGALVVLHLGDPPVTHTGSVPWQLLAAAFLAVEVGKVHLRLRRETHSLSLSEIPLVLALVFTSPAVLFATRGLGTVLAYVVFWRQRGVKLAWNLSRLALETGLALTVHRAVLGDASATSPRGWVAAYAATVAVDVLAGLAVTTVLAVRAGRQEWRGTPGVLLVGVAAAVVTTSLALVGALLFSQQPLALLLLGVLAVVLLLAYRSHTLLTAGLTSLRVLHEFTRAVSRSVREPDVVATTLSEARSLLRAEVAELVLARGDAYVRVRSDGAGTSGLDDPAGSEVPAWLQPSIDGAVVRLTRHRRERDGASVQSATGHRDVLAVPLRMEDVVVGALLVADRVDAISTFDADDERLLETLAGSAAVALRNGRLVERLLDEAAQKEHRALHDPLTGLLNRSGMSRRLDEAPAGGDPGLALLHVMLGGIAEVRADISHEAGDALLVAATGVLRDGLPAGALLARLSGDDLAVALPTGDGTSARALAGRLVERLADPVAVEGLAVPLHATIGIAPAAAGGGSEALLLQAQAAGYRARDTGSAVHVHSAGPDDHGRRRLALATDLAAAVRRGQLELTYQPKVALATGAVVGVEALARWSHPERGPVSPTEFVPLAESAGLISELTLHVLDTSLAQCAAWRSAGLSLSVAVNLSMRSLHELSLCEDVGALLASHDVPPSHLVLEITEGSMMTRPGATLTVLHRLRDLGVGLSMDDFGTGYSSLAYLAQMPLTELKIDKSFVMGLAASEADRAIVRSTVGLAHDLGLRVVGEGVEDVACWNTLRGLDCDLAQGYLLSRPLPAAALTEWLHVRSAVPRQGGPPEAEATAPARRTAGRRAGTAP